MCLQKATAKKEKFNVQNLCTRKIRRRNSIIEEEKIVRNFQNVAFVVSFKNDVRIQEIRQYVKRKNITAWWENSLTKFFAYKIKFSLRILKNPQQYDSLVIEVYHSISELTANWGKYFEMKFFYGIICRFEITGGWKCVKRGYDFLELKFGN